MSGALLPTITRTGLVDPLYDPYGSDPSDVNVIASTITVDGDNNNVGIEILNGAQVIFADGATIGANSMSIQNLGGVSTIAGGANPLSIFDYGNGTYGTTQVGGLIVGGSASTNDGSGLYAVIDGTSNADMSIRSRVLDLQVSSITNTLGNFIQFEENLIVRPPLGQTTAGGGVNIFNGASCSNFNQYQLAVNGDGALGGQLALTRFQGGSSFPVFNIDNDGNMLFKDPGAIVYADNLSTIALQAGTVNGGSLLGSAQGLLGSFSGGTTGASQSAFLTTGGSSNIAVTQGAVMCLEGTVNVDTVVAGADFGWSLTLNNGAQDIEIIGGITTPYKTGGALSGAKLPFATTFVAQGPTVQLFVTSGTGAGVADTVQANLNAPTIIRVR